MTGGDWSRAPGDAEARDEPGLPLLPGFREMALRRMASGRRRLVSELTAQRRSAGLSQTQIAARMGTSQSAVARIESGGADVRASTLERYAAAIGSQLSWQLDGTPPARSPSAPPATYDPPAIPPGPPGGPARYPEAWPGLPGVPSRLTPAAAAGPAAMPPRLDPVTSAGPAPTPPPDAPEPAGPPEGPARPPKASGPGFRIRPPRDQRP